ncbi:MAG: adenylate kinase [Candidatus Omnitrophota bacterium]|nr:adenylate kinase [Candidatus Omnitrophota bacterium]
MKLVLLGPPGAGKGTQSAVLAKEYKIPHISTGDILRAAVKSGSPMGMKAKAFMDKGELVPDEVVTGIVVERLKQSDTKKGYILDGFPRTLKQANDLDEALKLMGESLDLVIYFDTTAKVAIERLSGRRVCKKCGFNYHVKNIPPKKEGVCDKCGGELFQRPDDKEATVLNRLKVYEEQTKPLIDYYANRGNLKKVSGDLGVDKLFKVLSAMFQDAGVV